MDRPRTIPYHWWGDAWAIPNPRRLTELVAGGMLTADTADELADHVGQGGSVVVVTAGSGTGKSTLAHALVACCPVNRQRIYVRGNQESFAWASSVAPDFVTLLVNEISPHLPVYLWGEKLDRLLALWTEGAQVIATAHATSARDVLQLLPDAGRIDDRVVASMLVVALNEDHSDICPVRAIEPLSSAVV